MRLRICAVGRMAAAAPEAALMRDWCARTDRVGRPLGLGPVSVVEVEDRQNAGPAAEAALLLRAVPAGAVRVVLDERGQLLSSPGLAERLGRWRDEGRAEAAFVIGGADGTDPAVRAGADLVLSFGAMVWPHMLVRAMLAEQLYRAATILGGGPYHRG
jgi:23S rRNA (pseudouridine1915-N3)-methyltransferase